MMHAYEVWKPGAKWIILRDGYLFLSYPSMTQQQAIETAKDHAKRDRGTVMWRDADGNEQGRVSYA